jgi:3-oxoacyl-(acyl-carrier-protein) synthase
MRTPLLSPGRAVEVIGWGLVCSAGSTADEASQNILGLQAPGPRRVRSSLLFEDVPCAAFAVSDAASAEDRMLGFLEAAYADALNRAGLCDDDVRDAFLFGGTTGGSVGPEYRQNMARLAEGLDPHPSEMREEGPGVILRLFCERHDLGRRGHVTVTTACTSGAVGLLAAMQMILQGACDTVLVAGYEALLGVTITGFQNLLLYEQSQCRPFSADRGGILMGEGAGVLILRKAGGSPSSLRRRIWMCGGVLTNSNASFTSADTSGGGVLTVMRQALDAAGVTPRDVVGVKAHGTGTVDNDLAEGRALLGLFPDDVPPLSVLKSSIGHALGACGALETALYCACLEKGFLPPSPHAHIPDREIQGITPLLKPAAAPDGNYVLNFLGFGGSFSSLVLRVEGARIDAEGHPPARAALQSFEPVIRLPPHQEDALVVVAAGGVSTGLRTAVRTANGGADTPFGWDDVPPVTMDIHSDPDMDAVNALLPAEILTQLRRSGRYIRLCVAGAHAVISQFHQSDITRMRVGLFLCSGLGNQDEIRIVTNQCFASRGQVVSAFRFLNSVANIPLFTLAQTLRIAGPQVTVSQQNGAVDECLRLAEVFLRSHQIDLAFVGGCDVLVRPYKWLPLRGNLQSSSASKLESAGRFFGEGSHWLALTRPEEARRSLPDYGPFIPLDASLHAGADGVQTDVFATSRMEALSRAYSMAKVRHRVPHTSAGASIH